MKQNEIARKYAVQELEQGYGWRSSSIDDMINLFREDEKQEKEYIVLEKMAFYPNHIIGGYTWNRFMSGVLLNSAIVDQIADFYENSYVGFLKQLIQGEFESRKPIWIVVQAKELEKDTVYPLITNYNGHKNCIVLVINEI